MRNGQGSGITTLLVAACTLLAGCSNVLSPGSSEGTRAAAGKYALVAINGVPVEGEPGQLAGCPQAELQGWLDLDPSIGNRRPLYSLTVLAEPAAHDVGPWTISGGTVRFTSGWTGEEYAGEIDGGVEPPRITVTVPPGARYTYERLWPYDGSAVGLGGYLSMIAVDPTGAPVNGLRMLARDPYGLPKGGTTAQNSEFMTAGGAGAWYVTLTPPEGYRLEDPALAESCVTVAGEQQITQLRVVLAPEAP